MSAYRMNCGEANEKLPLFVGGDLDPEVFSAMQTHLLGCPDCARRASAGQRARRELGAAFRASTVAAHVPSLWPGIRTTLRAEGLVHEPASARAPRVLPRRGRRLLWVAPLVAAAAVLVVLQAGGALVRDRVSPKGTPERPAVEVVLPTVPAGGTLRPIDPLDVEPLVPFQPRRRSVRDAAPASDDIFSAGYQAGRIR